MQLKCAQQAWHPYWTSFRYRHIYPDLTHGPLDSLAHI